MTLSFFSTLVHHQQSDKLCKKNTPELVNLKIGAFFCVFLAQREIFIGHDLQISHFVLKTAKSQQGLADEVLPGVDCFICHSFCQPTFY